MAANSTKEIKRRQRSIGNTQKVTRAMEMVSAAKMRKSQLRALAARPYAEHVLTILRRLGNVEEGEKRAVREAIRTNPFFAPRDTDKTLLVFVASDKGLIGGLNANLISATKRFLAAETAAGRSVEAMAVGVKAHAALTKLNVPVIADFSGVGDYVEPGQIEPITASIVRAYEEDPSIGRVVALFAEFHSTLKQSPATRQILPISAARLEADIEAAVPESGRFSEAHPVTSDEEENPISYVFEPDVATLLAELVPSLISIASYHLILEANASEHSARMIAMRNASSNAERLLDALTLSYNKARQAAITREISEVSSGAEALRTQ